MAAPTETENFVLPLERWLPERDVLPKSFRHAAQQILDIPLKDDDIWVGSLPKSGTTWMQEMIWLLVNNLDYTTAMRESINKRTPFVEVALVQNSKEFNKEAFDQSLERITNLPGRRIVKSHLHWDKIPSALRKPNAKQKIVYLARHPRDVCFSWFYLFRLIHSPEHVELGTDLERWGNMFINDQVLFTPYWTHVLEFWKRRNEPNVFFVRYEEMRADLEDVVRRLTKFLDVPMPEGEALQGLLTYLNYDSVVRNPAFTDAEPTNFEPSRRPNEPKPDAFIKEGEINRRRTKMSPELIEKFDEWIQRNTQGTDFPFYAKSKQ